MRREVRDGFITISSASNRASKRASRRIARAVSHATQGMESLETRWMLSGAVKALVAPDLAPYTPAGWSAPLMISASTGAVSTDKTFYSNQSLYVDWAVKNTGTADAASSFVTTLLIDGKVVQTWSADSLAMGSATQTTDFSIGALSAGNHTLQIVTDSGKTVTETSETNNAYSKTISVTAWVPDFTPVQPTGWADKIVVSTGAGSTTAATTMYSNQNLYANWAIKNIGLADDSATFTTSLLVDGKVVQTWDTASLAAGESLLTTGFSLGTLTAGNHTLQIITDSGKTVTESSETNNTYTKTISVTAWVPDFTPTLPTGWADKIVVSTDANSTTAPKTIYSNQNLYVNWAIKNIGLADDSTTFTTSLLVDGKVVQTWDTDSIASGTSLVISGFSLGTLTAGNHTLQIIADSGKTVVESNETNNTYTKTIGVTAWVPDFTPSLPTGWADKIVVTTDAGSTAAPKTIYSNQVLYANWAIKNIGLADDATTFTTSLLVDGKVVQTWDADSLKAGESFVTTGFSIGTLAAGTHILQIVTDSGKTVTESSESNNTYSKTIGVTAWVPDLTPAIPTGWADKIIVSTESGSTTAAKTMNSNQNLYVSWGVKNIGVADDTDTFTTSLLVDGKVVQTWDTDSLASGSTLQTTGFSLGTLTAGNHTLQIVTDSNKAVTEASETNNTYSKTITIIPWIPDFTPYAPTGWSAPVVVSTQTGATADAKVFYNNQTLLLDWTIKNAGIGDDQSTFVTTLLIDGKAVQTWSADSLAAGALLQTADVSIGLLSVGNHTIQLVADSGKAVTESSETNNAFSKTITVKAWLPDLTPATPTGWTAPIVVATQTGTTTDAKTLFSNQNLYLDWAAKNADNADVVTSFNTSLYVDGTLTQTWATSSLASGATQQTTDFLLGMLAKGTHTLKIVIDPDSAIAESSETNNTYTKTITVVDPPRADLTPTKPTGWSDKMIIARSAGAVADAAAIYDNQSVYINWGAINSGAAESGAFSATLSVDGTVVKTWSNLSIGVGKSTTVTNFTMDPLSVGVHTLLLTLDSNSDVTETNETNNTFSKNVVIIASSGVDWFTQNLSDVHVIAAAQQAVQDDGVIDRNDMINILRADDGPTATVTAAQLHDLQAILTNGSQWSIPSSVTVLAGDVVNGSTANAYYQGGALGNLAAGKSTANLDKLVNKWFLGADHPVASASYQSFAGTLWGTDGPKYTDSNQGYLGDCYFLSSLDALAKTQPSAVQSMFTDNGDHTWTIRFYYNGTADYVTVDNQLPARSYAGSYSPIYASTGGNSASTSNKLWMALLEKAYVQWNETGKPRGAGGSNNYSSIEGGVMSYVDAQVLGHSASSYSFDDANKSALVSALQAGSAVTLGTLSNPGAGLVGGHAYAVLGYNASTDTFTLYNPWGSNQPGTLTYAQLKANCFGFTIA